MRKEHVLVIRFSALGDVAMTVPVVWSVARQYPDVRFTVLSRGFARAFFEDLAPNIGFMEADVKGEYHGVKGLNRLYRRLTAKHFTAIADLHNVLRSDYLRLRFNLGRFRVAHVEKHRLARHRLVAANNKVFEPLPTAIERYAEVFAQLGYAAPLTFRSIFGEGRGDLTSLPQDFLSLLPPLPTEANGTAEAHWEGFPLIGIAPFAAHQGKVYPVEMMEQAIDLLLERHPDARIFLFGGGDREMQVFSGWCAKHPQCINASAHLKGLRQELILMSHLDVMLSMDSGNMHLASLTATPVVSIWGATHPYAGFMGYGQTEDNALQIDLPCRPCSIFGNKPCHRGDYACLHNIRARDIISKVEDVINARKSL